MQAKIAKWMLHKRVQSKKLRRDKSEFSKQNQTKEQENKKDSYSSQVRKFQKIWKIINVRRDCDVYVLFRKESIC